MKCQLAIGYLTSGKADHLGRRRAAHASLAAGVGMPTLEGFEIVSRNIYMPEYAEVESVAPRIYLLSRMIMELSKR